MISHLVLDAKCVDAGHAHTKREREREREREGEGGRGRRGREREREHGSWYPRIVSSGPQGSVLAEPGCITM